MSNNTPNFIAFAILFVIIPLLIALCVEQNELAKYEKEYEETHPTTYYYDALPCNSELLSSLPKVEFNIVDDYFYPYKISIGDYQLKAGDYCSISDYDTDIVYGATFFIHDSGEISSVKDFIKTYGNCVKEKYGLELSLHEDIKNESASLNVTDINIKNGIASAKQKMEKEKKEITEKSISETNTKIYGK